jgi:hypothetical protein
MKDVMIKQACKESHIELVKTIKTQEDEIQQPPHQHVGHDDGGWVGFALDSPLQMTVNLLIRVAKFTIQAILPTSVNPVHNATVEQKKKKGKKQNPKKKKKKKKDRPV